MLESLRLFVENLIGAGSPHMVNLALLASIAVLAVLFYYVTRLLLVFIEHAVVRTPTSWDDDLLTPRFLRAISQLTPAFLVSWMLPGLFEAGNSSMHWMSKLTSLYIIAALAYAIIVLLSNLKAAFIKRPGLADYGTSSLFQTVILIVVGISAIFGISVLIGRSPVTVLTALGASAAVLMLVFKDTILGLVASVQLTANKMLKKGNWIVADKHGANGTVEDISLTTIKVKNWDNSVTTIPPYSLVSDSFRNYDPMRIDGTRRVERAFFIDASTVHFATAGELDTLRSHGMLEGIDIEPDKSCVNLGLLRRYLEVYLENHPMVSDKTMIMVRQLDPTSSGLPVQLYFFTSITDWKEYEHIQSDIMDHVYAITPLFGLRIFQTPSGADIAAIK